MPLPPGVQELADGLAPLGVVRDLLVAGSLATGDHVDGVSDLDLVAVVDGPVDGQRRALLAALHRRLDAQLPAGTALGCVYVDEARLPAAGARHPTWTHGVLVDRVLSGIARAELVRHGWAVAGRPPREVLPAMEDDEVREAARAEVLGWWAGAVRRPWLWLDPVVADLGLTSMARARHTLATGQLLTKTLAVESADVPDRLRAELRARRRGEAVTSPRVRTGLRAWRDTRRTVAVARRSAPGGRHRA